jgi:hypothetical protein
MPKKGWQQFFYIYHMLIRHKILFYIFVTVNANPNPLDWLSACI